MYKSVLIRKFWSFLTFCFFCFAGLVYSSSPFFSLEISYFSRFKEIFRSGGFSFLFDKTSIIFLYTVVLVTCLVSLFSEAYIEHYNSKKFFFIIILFFFSIILLVHSSNFITFFMGWDGLGVSSICLIMFYPNKITLYNSFLTIIFNRLGDVIFILIFCLAMMNFTFFILILDSNYSVIFFILVLICSFTKRAQFPLSSWLPAAMSAPTPISAIVHSSTLVTAGVYIVHKMGAYFFIRGLQIFFIYFRFLTFALGGLMANIEIDFKKIVAFSTIRQISMIIFFCSLGFYKIALSHTMFHAFFKTLLFCVAGVFFMIFFSDQFKNHFFSFKGADLVRLLLLSSIFRMTGLIFSSSFVTKDLVLEIVGANRLFFYFFILVFSFMTLYYCCKLFRIRNSKSYVFSFSFYKSYFNFFWSIFFIFTLFRGVFLSKVVLSETYIIIRWLDLIFVIFLFFLPFITMVAANSSLFFFLALSISFIKFFSFSLLRSFLKIKFSAPLLLRERFFIKKHYFWALNNFRLKFSFRIYSISFFFIMGSYFLFYSFSLIRTEHWRCYSNRIV